MNADSPPLLVKLPDTLLAGHHALLAHGRSMQSIQANARKPASIYWSPSATVFYPHTDSPADTEAPFAVFPSAIWDNAWPSDPVVFGRYPKEYPQAYGSATPKIRTRI